MISYTNIKNIQWYSIYYNVLNSFIHEHRQQFNSHPRPRDSGPQALLQMLAPLVGLASVWACLLLRWPCLNKFQQATTQAWTKAYRDYCGMTTDSDYIQSMYASFSYNLAALLPPAGKGLPVILNHRSKEFKSIPVMVKLFKVCDWPVWSNRCLFSGFSMVCWSFTYDMLRHARKKLSVLNRHGVGTACVAICAALASQKKQTSASALPFSTIERNSIADCKTLPEGLGA